MWLVWDILAALGSGILAALAFVVVLVVGSEISFRLWPSEPEPQPAPKLRHVCTRYEYIYPDTGNKRILWLSSYEPVQEADAASPDAA